MSSGQTVFLFAALMLSSLFMPWVESPFDGKLVPWDTVSHVRDEKNPWQVITPERVGLQGAVVCAGLWRSRGHLRGDPGVRCLPGFGQAERPADGASSGLRRGSGGDRLALVERVAACDRTAGARGVERGRDRCAIGARDRAPRMEFAAQIGRAHV